MKNTGDVEYDVITGVSLGAINAFIVSSTKPGDEAEASKRLNDFWLSLAEKGGGLISSWGWGVVYGFFYEQCLYDA